MLYPYTRSWTRRQKWLIVIATLALTPTLCALVYTYDRYYGLPTQEILVGTWEHPEGMIWDPPSYYEFHANHTISSFTIYPDGKEYGSVFGRWYAFGPNIYVMFPKGAEPRLIIWHIVDVSEDQLRIWSVRRSYEETLKRAHLHALSPEERTVVGTWEAHDIDSVSYMTVAANHTVAAVSSGFDGKDLQLVGTGTWSVVGDDLKIELVSGLDDDTKPLQKSTWRMKIADFVKDRARHGPVKYRMP